MQMCSPLWTNLVPCCTGSLWERSSVWPRTCNWFYWSPLTFWGWVGWQILLYCQWGQNRPLDFTGNVLLPNDPHRISSASINVSLLLKSPLGSELAWKVFSPFIHLTKRSVLLVCLSGIVSPNLSNQINNSSLPVTPLSSQCWFRTGVLADITGPHAVQQKGIF